jgi:hypothetical protein
LLTWCLCRVGSPAELYRQGGTFYDMVHHSGEAAGLEEALAAAESSIAQS